MTSDRIEKQAVFLFGPRPAVELGIEYIPPSFHTLIAVARLHELAYIYPTVAYGLDGI